MESDPSKRKLTDEMIAEIFEYEGSGMSIQNQTKRPKRKYGLKWRN